jgi:hypothetical protein
MAVCAGDIADYHLKSLMNCGILLRKFGMRRVGKNAMAAAVVCSAVPAFAQGCALCYTQAASASARFVHALRSGILVLVFPPLLISAGLATAAYRKRDRFRASDAQSERSADSRAGDTHQAELQNTNVEI